MKKTRNLLVWMVVLAMASGWVGCGKGRQTREDLEKVAGAACIGGETIHNMPFDVHPPMVVDAMLAADAYGRQRRALLAGEAALPEVAH